MIFMKMVLVAILFLFAATLHAASFDCSKAKSHVEQIICANGELSKLDEEMASAYRDAIISLTNPQDLKLAQRTWITQVRNNCKSEDCVVSAYKERLVALNSEPLEKPSAVGGLLQQAPPSNSQISSRSSQTELDNITSEAKAPVHSPGAQSQNETLSSPNDIPVSGRQASDAEPLVKSNIGEEINNNRYGLPAKFLNSKVVTPIGLNNFPFGEFTVAELTEKLSKKQLDNGSYPEILGWKKDDNIYVLSIKIKNDPIDIVFTHILSEKQGAGAYSFMTGKDGNNMISGIELLRFILT